MRIPLILLALALVGCLVVIAIRKLATCENAETGKVIAWPSRPLTVRGSFERLPLGPGQETASPGN